MLNKLLIGAALALSLAACASTPPSPDAAKSTVARTQPSGCAGTTATSRPDNPQKCAGFGSVYTKDDMDRTGANTLGDALRLLDPTVSVRGP
jgi:phenylalanyl-tRNA synthetase alpha subunit